jgi:hypothetical protein
VGASGQRHPGGDDLGVPAVPADRPSRGSGRSTDVGLKSEIDLARAAIAKATRNEIRQKHSLRAEREINETLAVRLREFDAALQRGVILTYTLELVVADAPD